MTEFVGKFVESVERLERHSEIAFVGTTQYRNYSSEENNSDSIRGNIALEQMRRLKNEGFRIILIDSESSREFVNKITELEIEIIPQDPNDSSLSSAKRKGFEKASQVNGVKFIITTEVEKPWSSEALDKLVEPLRNNQADMTIPSRCENPTSEEQLRDFCGYPPEQARYEALGNKTMNDTLHQAGLLDPAINLDLYNGTRAFRNTPEILELMSKKFSITNINNWLYDQFIILNPETTDYNKDIFKEWDKWFAALFSPPPALLIQGFKIRSILIPYKHPLEQTAIETGSNFFTQKRVEQFFKIVWPFNEYVRLLLKERQ